MARKQIITSGIANAAITAAKLNASAFASPTFTGTVTVSGGQIAFPNIVNLSAGANTLDDYEEGTWSPTFSAITTAIAGPLYAAATYGIYVKIGKTVFISGTVALAAVCYYGPCQSGSGGLIITSLPFNAAGGTAGGYGSLACGYRAGWATTTPGTAYVQAGGSFIMLFNQLVTTQITPSNLTDSASIQFSGFYTTTL